MLEIVVSSEGQYLRVGEYFAAFSVEPGTSTAASHRSLQWTNQMPLAQRISMATALEGSMWDIPGAV